MVTEEFYAQGELELAAGIPESPLCKKENTAGSAWGRSQIGFIKFAVSL